MSHVDRKSKYTKLAKLPDKSAYSVVRAGGRILLPQNKRKHAYSPIAKASTTRGAN